MKNLKIYLSLLLAIVALSSCDKVIELDLGNRTGELVIEGKITDIDGPQYVKLTTNVPFTNTNTYPPVTGATVLINDDQGNSFPFTETSAGTYSIDLLKGISGRTYTMSVTSNGKNYKASSVMPVLVNLDSVSTKASLFDNKKRLLTVHYQDPAGIANQYRLVIYVNDVQVKAVFALNDEFNDGKYVHMEIRQDDIDIYSGDRVTIEMQCIDRPVYTYWFTLAQQQESGPGGSVTPTNPPTNISPVTLGYFSAHTSQTLSIIAK